MATNTNTTAEEGYSIDIFLCDISDFVCPICYCVLRDAVEPVPSQPGESSCHHKFCEQCLQRSFADGPGSARKCPECQCNLVAPPHAGYQPCTETRALVDDMLVVCPEKGKGCSWRGAVKELAPHLSTACEFSMVACAFCQLSMPMKQVQTHQDNECPQRHVTCGECQQQLKACEEQEHKKVCVGALISCDLCHQTGIRRADLVAHKGKDCPEEQVPCLIACAGCTHKGPRKEQEEHVRASVVQHLVMMSALCVSTEKRAEAAEKRCEEMQAEQVKLREQLAAVLVKEGGK